MSVSLFGEWGRVMNVYGEGMGERENTGHLWRSVFHLILGLLRRDWLFWLREREKRKRESFSELATRKRL